MGILDEPVILDRGRLGKTGLDVFERMTGFAKNVIKDGLLPDRIILPHERLCHLWQVAGCLKRTGEDPDASVVVLEGEISLEEIIEPIFRLDIVCFVLPKLIERGRLAQRPDLRLPIPAVLLLVLFQRRTECIFKDILDPMQVLPDISGRAVLINKKYTHPD